MGEVVSLDQRRRARTGERAARPVAAPPATTLFFDLGTAGTYFAAERADRLFPGLSWRPVLLERPAEVSSREQDATLRAAVTRAAALGMPLVWPEGIPSVGRAAMRVAAFAAERGQASPFVLAASRLAFCGGFDLDDPEILAEAAAAAALPFEECLRAAGDRSRDEVMLAAGRKLAVAGLDELPAVRVGRRLFCGEERLGQAAAALRDGCGQRRGTGRDESAG